MESKYNKLSKSSPLYPTTKTGADFAETEVQRFLVQGDDDRLAGKQKYLDEEVEVNFDNMNVNTSQQI